MQSLSSKYTIVSILLFTVLFFIAGQLAGASIFFYITNIPIHYVGITSLFDSWNEYSHQQQFKAWLQLSVAMAVIINLLPITIYILAYTANNKKEKIHGSAKWATNSDLKKSGLFPNDKQRKSPAILLGKMPKGKYKDRYLELQGQTFVGLSAPTGSGKGVGIVLPNLLNYSDSVVNTDIKLENFFKTAGYRKSQGQDVYLFAPDGYAENEDDRASGVLRSHRWNPFYYIRRDEA